MQLLLLKKEEAGLEMSSLVYSAGRDDGRSMIMIMMMSTGKLHSRQHRLLEPAH